MADKKQALLVFCKPPIPGTVKTRLTIDHGGFLTQEQAAAFFKCCLFDVCEASMHALIQMQEENDAQAAEDPDCESVQYDFFISTTPKEDEQMVRDMFDEIGPWPMEIHYITDKGATFDDHFDDAFKQIFDMGYEHIVSVGGDIPTMPKSHVIQAFQWLDYFRSHVRPGFVVAPCQECGTSLVGFSYDTPIDHQGVYYNMNGKPALDAYMEKTKEKDIPIAYFSPIADVDEKVDLAHAVSCMKAIEQAAQYQSELFVPKRTLAWVRLMNIKVTTPPNEEHDPRQYIDE